MKVTPLHLIRLVWVFLLCLSGNFVALAQEASTAHRIIELVPNTDRSIQLQDVFRFTLSSDQVMDSIHWELPAQLHQKPINYQMLNVIHQDRLFESKTAYRTPDKLTISVGPPYQADTTGAYLFLLVYRVPEAIEFQEEGGQCNWPIFPIQQSMRFAEDSTTIHLRRKDDITKASLQLLDGDGSISADSDFLLDSAGYQLTVQRSNDLTAKQTLNIATSFEQGAIASTFKQYLPARIIGIGAAVWLAYMVVTFFLYGVDPPKPALYPIHEAPGDRSPGQVGYLSKEKYTAAQFAGTIINLVNKEYIDLQEPGNNPIARSGSQGAYRLRKIKSDTTDLPEDEQMVFNALFESNDTVELSRKNRRILSQASAAQESSLKHQYEELLGAGDNKRFVGIGYAIAFITGALALFVAFRNAFLYVDLMLLEAIIMFVAVLVLPIIWNFISNIRSFFKSALFWMIFVVVGVVVFRNSDSFSSLLEAWQAFWSDPETLELIKFYRKELEPASLWHYLSGSFINLFAMLLFLPFALIARSIYDYVIKKPTEERLQLQAEVASFKMHLEQINTSQFSFQTDIPRKPDSFSATLPYTIAMEAGELDSWTAKFKKQLSRLV